MYIMIGSVYKISSKQTDKMYIGSTIQSLNKRFTLHKCKTKYNINSCLSRLIVCYDDCTIELLEEVEIEDRNDIKLKQRERYYIDTNKENVVNIQIPLRTMREWIVDNREHLRQYDRQYRINNLQKIKDYKYTKISCDCGNMVSRNNMSTHKKKYCRLNKTKN